MTNPEPTKRSRATPILTGIAALLFVALLVVPGYIAGYYCRLAHDEDSTIAIELAGLPPGSWSNAGLQIFLTPACLATKIAPSLRGFYWKQFYAASRHDDRIE